jgi:Ca2+-binding EF-hand superfamily protein
MPDANAEAVRRLDFLFSYLDASEDGRISSAELGMFLRMLGREPSARHLEQQIAAADTDGDGFIRRSEFDGLVDRVTVDGGGSWFEAVFHAMDRDRDGQVTALELRQAVTRLQLPLTRDRVTELADQMDADGSGGVDLGEFMAFMRPGRA